MIFHIFIYITENMPFTKTCYRPFVLIFGWREMSFFDKLAFFINRLRLPKSFLSIFTQCRNSIQTIMHVNVMQLDIWKIIYLNCGERHEFMIDHRSYTHNLSSREIKAWKNSGLNYILHDFKKVSQPCNVKKWTNVDNEFIPILVHTDTCIRCQFLSPVTSLVMVIGLCGVQFGL